MNTIKYIYNKTKGLLMAVILPLGGCLLGTSCEDMMDKGNEYVIYADDHKLSDPADTITSLAGIINQLQNIAVRTNLLGEVRADLVTVGSNASTDLQDLAAGNISEDNVYNAPRDYYAVINNCNFFLANVDSLAGNASRDEKYFETEIAQVHSIRAWTYLQLVINYGRVPLITEPVTTKLQAEARYPMLDIDGICDYFIKDLKPYYGKAYPDPGTFGMESVDPQMCFYPTQVVTGDLYLWRAAIAGKTAGRAYAKEAAKSYYDYIVWNLSGKKNLLTTDRRLLWTTDALTYDRYTRPGGSLEYLYVGDKAREAWGRTNVECVTIIPMDSASADGHYNELRNMYNTMQVGETWKESCIHPSSIIREMSRNQDYVDYDSYRDAKTVLIDKFTEEEINEGLYGDLRFWYNYSQEDMKLNNEEFNYQTIRKQNYQNIGIYRGAQIYLRLAEALNYAGYPRFARQILVMGLDNNVIQYEIQPFYTTAADTAFISYFDFSTNDFKTYVSRYVNLTDSLGVITGVSRQTQSSGNTIGIHSRGAGLTYINENYAPLLIPDSTNYPFTLAGTVGHKPVVSDYSYPTKPTIKVIDKPSTWDAYPGVKVDRDTYIAMNSDKSWYNSNTSYRNYNNRDSVALYTEYITNTLPDYEAKMIEYNHKTDSVNAVYQADMDAYNSRIANFNSAYDSWYKEAYGAASLIEKEQDMIDQLILEEQALELAFEGNRFYDLMRRAYWHNDNTILSNAVSKRDATAGARMANPKNWFLRWKDMIGL